MMDHPTGLELERVQNVARIIERSGRRLQRLIENYLYYAQLEMTSTDSQRRADFVGQGVENPDVTVLDAAREQCRVHDRDGDLVHTIEKARVEMSNDGLHKLVSEVVDNACKFSLPGTAIEVRAFVRDSYYVLSITDHGRGMEASEIANIGAYAQFQRNLFEQQGVGLGLAIARRLTELHRGMFSIRSVIGQGTTVEISLPILN